MVGELSAPFSKPIVSALIRVLPPQFLDLRPRPHRASPGLGSGSPRAQPASVQSEPRVVACRRPGCAPWQAGAQGLLFPDAESLPVRWCDRFCLRGARIFRVRPWSPSLSIIAAAVAVIIVIHKQERKS